MIGRFISTTNRRIDVLNYDGSTYHAANTTSSAPSGLNTLSIGDNELSTPSNFFNGRIAEAWVMQGGDVTNDGGALNDGILRKLAFQGPFSLSYVANKLVEYRSLRAHPTADSVGETYSAGPRQTWTNTNSVTVALHPPIYASYVRPGQTRRSRIV